MVGQTSSLKTIKQQFEEAFPTSRQYAEKAKACFPDGVTHDLRRMEPFPIYVDRASGSYKWEVDGRRLIDYWAGHGALLLGHSHPAVVQAVQKQIEKATHPGACHALEIQWAELVQKLIPCAEKVRFVSSGTEATLMALRLARLYTGREKILKFTGHFHGWHDFVTSGADAPYSDPIPGISRQVAEQTVVIPPNDPDLVESTIKNDPSIAAIILEPTGGHWGQVPIRGPFLKALREITNRHDRLLIFDEVITGFRVHPGGAQAHYGITPDLTTLAKILAGGLPGGCVAGKADILDQIRVRPGKPKMKHPGTFNANPLSACAGIATLQMVSTGVPCRQANAMAAVLRKGLNTLFAEKNLNWVAYGDFSGFRILTGYQGPPPVEEDFIPYSGDASKLEVPQNSNFVHSFRQALLLHGIDMVGLSGMLTMAHTQSDILDTLQGIESALEDLQKEGLLQNN